MVTDITDQDFADATSEGVSVIDFWASWCGPCRVQGPVIEELAQERQDVEFFRLDVEANKKTPQALGIMAIPTLIIKKDGKIIDRLTGFTAKNRLDDLLDEYTLA